jgi:predicted DNA-binding transcriptional regulator YafY/predicted RNA-binding Zn-ribbon protein involved in translation (DUF1610 family)
LSKYNYDFSDNDSCLEWLKNQRYPEGIKCPNCGKITRHHKLTNNRCYSCDNCGNHTYPTAGTMFHKSTTPLNIWFKVITRVSDSRCNISIKEIQREYRVTYKTAWRMVKKIRRYLKEKKEILPFEINFDKAVVDEIVNNRQKRIGGKRPVNVSNKSNQAEGVSFTDLLLKVASNKEENKSSYHIKRDRTARLLRLQILLWQNPQGLTIEELSRKCLTSKRTIYRDLQAIESELHIPIWEEGNKRGIVEGHYLPPISFNIEEAFNIFMASRLLQKQAHSYKLSLASTLMKISTVIPPFLRNKIIESMEYIEHEPVEDQKIRNLKTLIQAWMTQHRVKILYRDEYHPETTEIIIEPYFMEPMAGNRTIYAIAFCPLKQYVYSYNIDRIIGDVTLCADKYEIPIDFNFINVINSTWGLPDGDETTTVKLHFQSTLSKIIMSTLWHPSQVFELQDDGSLLATYKITRIGGFQSWVLSWGDKVEVLEPQTYREKIANLAASLSQIYSIKNN